MYHTEDSRLVVAISARALFDLSESHKVWEDTNGDVAAFCQYQTAHENEILQPGPAFALVRKLLALNSPNKLDRVEVVLLSRNSPDAGLRVMHAIQHYGLNIERAVFSQGGGRFRYAKAFRAHLFLSTHSQDVKKALEEGIAAAALLPKTLQREDDGVIRIAFDGDAVIFSDEAERIYKSQGLPAFQASEQAAAAKPLGEGPFMHVLYLLHRIQSESPEMRDRIRLALCTARGVPAHERVLRTLRGWGIRLDEAAFVGGLGKGPFLQAFGADIFFDDQKKHVENAAEYVPSGHVIHGVANEQAA